MAEERSNRQSGTEDRMHRVVLGLTFAVVTTSISAQAPTAPLKFDVASIRENKSGSGASFSSPRPGGTYNASNMTLRGLVWVSYRIPMERVIGGPGRSEEHTSELQSQSNLVCRLL